MKRLLCAIIIFTTSYAWAAPNVTGVTGTVSDGSSITIGGTAFGAGSTIISWDDFESHTTGTGISGKTPTVGPNWSLYRLAPATDDIVVSTTRAHGGSKSVMIEWTDETINSFGWANQGPYTQLYITWWGYQQFAGSISTCNRKWFYLYGNNTAGCYDIGVGSQSPQFMPLIPSGNTVWGAYNNQSASQGSWSDTNNTSTNTTYGTGNAIYWSNTSNAWGRWEYWQKLNTSPTCTIGSNCDGEITYWYNAVKRYERTNYKHSFCTGSYRDFRLGHMWQGHIDNATYAFVDDLFIATSQARIEIGNASTWDACTQREIQRHTAWSDTSATITVNAGTFSDGQTVYVYTVDEDGVPNPTGYAVTIGNESTDTTAPTLSGFSPAKSATDQPIDTDISAVFSDAGSGVDVNTLQMFVEDVSYCCTTMTGTCPFSGTKVLTCTGDTSAVTVTKSGNTFSSAQTVDVILDGADLDGNSMAADSYSFTTTAAGADSTDPTVAITGPTSQNFYYTTDGATTFNGTSSDNVEVSSVAWVNSQGGSGTATGVGPWSVDVLPLAASTFGATLVANGLFNSDYASWTANNATVSQGTNADRANSLSIEDNGSWSEVSQTITVEDGELYLIEALVYSLNSDWPENGSILIDNAAARTDTWGDTQLIGNGTPNTWQTIAGVVRAVGTSMTIRLHSEDIYTAYFDSVSVRKVTGANVITVTATDSSANTGTGTLTIIYNPPTPAASAPMRVMVQDANGKTWVYDAAGAKLVAE